MDTITYALLKKKIDSLGISDTKILEVIETFLLAHPEYIGATDEQVAQIAANAAAIQELQNNAVDTSIDEALDENSVNPVQNKVITKEINEIKKSVSDGKSKVASAITEKDVNTEATDTFDVMAENIRNIPSGNICGLYVLRAPWSSPYGVIGNIYGLLPLSKTQEVSNEYL